MPASASECTATVSMPRSRQVRNTRRAISPRLATSSLLIVMSHPEDAEAVGALDGQVVDHGQADAQDGAGVARVDDAVVVHHPGEEVRQRLLLHHGLHELAHAGVLLLVVR